MLYLHTFTQVAKRILFLRLSQALAWPPRAGRLEAEELVGLGLNIGEEMHGPRSKDQDCTSCMESIFLAQMCGPAWQFLFRGESVIRCLVQSNLIKKRVCAARNCLKCLEITCLIKSAMIKM